MSPAPGWFPDPGGSSRLRYWDGQRWTEHLSDPSSPPIATSPEPSGGGRRLLWIVVAGVVVLALIGLAVLLWPRGTDGGPVTPVTGGPAATATPTITGWDEQETPPPDGSPDPTPSMSSQTLLPCESVDWMTVAQSGSQITAGGFTYPRPSGWDLWEVPVSSVVTDSASLYRDVPDSSWMSTIEVGYVPGLDSERAVAETVLQCYFTSGSDGGYDSHEVLFSEEITLDGETGWWLKVRETNPSAPGTYAILHAIAIDRGAAEGISVFWTTAYEIDQKAVDDCEAAVRDLHLSP